MWNIRDIKERAKACMKANYWRTVLVTLIAGGLLAGGTSLFSLNNNVSLNDLNSLLNQDSSQSDLYSSGSTSGQTGLDRYMEQYVEGSGNSQEYGDDYYGDDYYGDGSLGGLEDFLQEYGDGYYGGDYYGDGSSDDGSSSLPDILQESGDADDILKQALNELPAGLIAIVVAVILFAALIVGLISMAFCAFLWNPLSVGCSRFYVQNTRRKAMVGEVGYGFDENYKTHVVTMLLRDIFLGLWTMLFIIPGIVKSYEYMMIPYILTDNPGITRKEAFALSREMMQGNKWHAFCLDLSFIGWFLLSGLTLGILGTFYVNPYYEMTKASLYEELCARRYSSEIPQPTYSGDETGAGKTFM